MALAGGDRVDVAVIGGGPAGIAAALASAREGARTRLIEREPRLGGNAANAFVHTICGLYEPAVEGEPLRFTNPGLPRQIATRLQAGGFAGAAERAGRVHYLPIDPSGLATAAASWCESRPGLEVTISSRLEAVRTDDAALRLEVQDGAGTTGLEAAVMIDTSGDATAVALAGAGTASAASRQRPSYIFRLAGVEPGAIAGFERVRTSLSVQGGVRDGALPVGCESVSVRPGVAAGDVFVTLTLAARADEGDLLDAAAVAALTSHGRGLAERVFGFLRETRPAFAGARVSAWPERIGIRETRRCVGARSLSADEVLAAHGDPGEVARSSWPIELWHDHRRAHFQHPRGSCSIPLACLVSGDDPRLGVAGRCMSASHEALGAVRVIGTALATGEAIGVAAALAADAGCSLLAVEPATVRARIEAHGDPA